jgi:hypothetical protein
MDELIEIQPGYWFWGGNERIEYGEKYLETYKRYIGTPMDKKLQGWRVAMVKQHHDGPVLDFGAGAGRFVDAYMLDTFHDAWGYDVNPGSRGMLGARFWEYPWRLPCASCAVTFWDSLEHLEQPNLTIRSLGAERIFIAIPIFRDKEHLLASKHYKPGEHLHYFTREGLEKYMGALDYTLISCDNIEQDCGREDILRFYFRRPHARATGDRR